MDCLAKKRSDVCRAQVGVYMRTNRKIFLCAWLIISLVVFICLPFFSSSYILSIAIVTCISIIGAVGLNLLTGYVGEISLGQGAFLAIGAYSAALYGNNFSLPFWLVLPLSGLTVAVVGSLVAIPALRLRGLYLAMATFSFQMLVEYAVRNWELTGKSNGIPAPTATIGGFEIVGEYRFYYLAFGVAALMVLIAWNLSRSRIGRAWLAIREKEFAASSLGVAVTPYKIQAYMISSFFAGIAGGLMAYYYGYVAPDFFTLTVSIQYLSMILVGGLGTISGGIMGAIFVVLIPEILRFLTSILPAGFNANLLELQEVIYGLMIVMVILFARNGLVGLWQAAQRGIKEGFSTKSA